MRIPILLVSLVVAAVMGGAATPARAQPATPLIFGSDAGLVLNFVQADKAAQFEDVLYKVKDALKKSPKPERGQQAKRWKVLKAGDLVQSGSVLYVFVMEPVLKGADYSIFTILSESFPGEAESLYKQYSEAYASGQQVATFGLKRWLTFAPSTPPRDQNKR